MSATPEIHVDAVRRIFDDGNHNGFTDMCWFRDEIYLAFRSSPTGHGVDDDSFIVILRSRDGVDWKQIHRYGPIADRDLRDPHFLVFRDTLFVYTGAWCIDPVTKGHDLSDHQGYAAWTTDGSDWQGPIPMKGTYGYYIWRCARFGDKAYLCGRRVALADSGDEPAVVESVMLESDDGLRWKPIGLFQAIGGNETAFVFNDDGSVVAVSRCRGEAQVCRARPPYRQWTRTGLKRLIGGPMLVKWGGRYLVGTRKWFEPGHQPRTVLSWLVDDQLVDMAELPSGGDNAYTGFVPLSETRGLVSYYSSHEGSGGKTPPCHIYLAEISVRETRA